MVGTQKCFNPFPGLRPFEADEDYLFFGREGQSDELLRRLQRNRFLAVVGTSGSGKSSLVRAGLLPSLHGGYMTKAGSSWRVAVLRPDSNPIGNLARALNQPNVLGSEAEDAAIRSIIFIETTLRRGALGLIEVVKYAKERIKDENLLIFVDQFEELLRFKQSHPGKDAADEAAAFVKLLLEATRQELVYVLLTMRSEYLGECAQFRDLPEVLNDSQYLIPRLTREQRRAAIVGPIAVGGAAIAPRLVNRMLNDVGDNPDQLPILQHALMRTWDYWMENHKDGEPIDFCHYEAIGGMTKALSKHADEIYNKLSAPHKGIAKKLFKCLTDKGPYGRGIRRPTSLKEVCDIATAEEEDVIAVVDQFRGPSCSFLMPPVNVNLDAKTVLDISHESLIRVWGRLKRWVDQEKESAQIYCRLADTSARQQEGKAGLLNDPELTIALNWCENNKPNEAWAQRYASNFEQAMQFLEASKAVRDAEIAEKERRQQEEIRDQQQEIELQKSARRKITYALVAAIACFFVASVLGLLALFQSWKVEKDNIKVLSTTSEELSASNQEFDALIEGLKAERELKWAGWAVNDADTQSSVVTALQRAVYWITERNRLEGHKDAVFRARFSPDGRMLATASRDNTVKLWKADGTLLKTLRGHRAGVWDVSFSRNGQMIASASEDHTVKLWKTDGTLLKTLKHNDPVYQVSFSPDGQMIASASADNTVKLWKADGTLLKTLKGHSDEVWNVSFSPNGQMIASASEDHTVKLWKADGTLLKTLQHNDPVYQVRFSPDGQMIASASADNTVKLWKADGTLLKTLKGHSDRVWDVNFSPDGQTLASASRDQTVKLWKTDGTLLKTLTGHSNDVYRVRFSADGKTLASASADNTVKLWRLDGTLLTTLTGHKDGVIDINFSPDSQTLASASYDNTIKLWRLHNNLLTILQGHQDWVLGVSFSPDGQTIATASRDNTVKLWKLDGTLLKTLRGHHDWVSGVSFSSDGQMLASASYDNTIKLWKSNGTLLKTLKHSAPVYQVSFSPDGQMLTSAGADNTIKLWKLDGTLLKSFSGRSDSVWDVRFSPDGQMLASAGADNTIKLWKLDGTLLRIFIGHRDQVLAVSFSPDGKKLASASRDKTVKIWRLDGTLLTTLTGHDDWVTSLSFSPDGQTLASASRDKTVKIWRLDGTLLTTLTGYHSSVLGVNFSPNGQMLASATQDKTAILWNLPNQLDNQILSYSLTRGCAWMHDYLETQPNANQEDRQLCEGK